MRKIVVLFVLTLFVSGCVKSEVAERPISEIPQTVSGQFGEQYEKRYVRMFNAEGELYYDTGLKSNAGARCGTYDGNLKMSAGEGEIPKIGGDANFNASGYQNATGITKEVNIDGEWIIFKKYENPPEDIENYKYCFYIKGRLNNAAVDSENIVLTDNKDITFSDVYEPLFSSQYPSCENRISHNRIFFDKWGLELSAEDVTRDGMTINFEQFGGAPSGQLQTGTRFSLESEQDGVWQKLSENPLIDYVWDDVAYLIKHNDVTKIEVQWKWLYGELSKGSYRLCKEVMDFRKTGDFDKEFYYVYFEIE